MEELKKISYDMGELVVKLTHVNVANRIGYVEFQQKQKKLTKELLKATSAHKDYKNKYTCDSCGEVTRSDKPIVKCLVCPDEPTEADNKLEEIIEEYEIKEANANTPSMVVCLFNDLMDDLRDLIKQVMGE